MYQPRFRTIAGLAVALGFTAMQTPALAGPVVPAEKRSTTTTTTLPSKPSTTTSSTTLKPTTTTKPSTTTTTKPTTTSTTKPTTTSTTKPSTTTTTKPSTTTTTKPSTTTTTEPSTTTTTEPSTTTTTEPSTTTTTEPSTTTTTEPTTTTTAPSTTTTTAQQTTTTSTTTTTSVDSTTTTTLPEICGNCLDDDGDGQVDFDDTDCCGTRTNIVLKRYSVRPRMDDGTTRTKLHSCLPLPNKDMINPFVQDLYVQMKNTKSGTFYCAVISSKKFMKLHTKAVAYWDRGAVKNPMAKGIQDASFTKRKCTGFYLYGPHMQYLAEEGSQYELTIGLQNPFVPENNVCATTGSGMDSGRAIRSENPRKR